MYRYSPQIHPFNMAHSKSAGTFVGLQDPHGSSATKPNQHQQPRGKQRSVNTTTFHYQPITTQHADTVSMTERRVVDFILFFASSVRGQAVVPINGS